MLAYLIKKNYSNDISDTKKIDIAVNNIINIGVLKENKTEEANITTFVEGIKREAMRNDALCKGLEVLDEFNRHKRVERADLRSHKGISSGLQDGVKKDVIIVGAGPGGLYAGWRLRTGDYKACGKYPLNVSIVEMSDRIGGRLESVTLPDMKILGELGGMRYKESHKILATLVEKVFKDELRSADFSMGGDPAHRFFYLRGQRFRADSWSKAQEQGKKFQVPYKLNEQDKGYSPDQLCNKIIYEVLMADPQIKHKYSDKILHPKEYVYRFDLSKKDWKDITSVLRYKNQLVKNIGFEDLVKDRVGQGGFEFLKEAGGYDSSFTNWNAAEALPRMAAAKSNPSYRTIEGGFDKIAYKLAKEFLSSPGVTGDSQDSAVIWTENRLIGFQKKGESYELRIFNQRKSKEWKAYTDALVLAMPQRSLELLMQDQQTHFFKSDQLRKNIRSVVLRPAYKLLLGFEKPWWKEKFGTEAGRSITNLPMRQCYYFGTDPDNQHSLLLASYSDMHPVEYWSALENSGSNEEDGDQQPGQPPQTLVNEAMKQIKALHGDESIPNPYFARSKDWSKDPYGGGYHDWKPHISAKDVMPNMRRPDLKERVYIAGSTYSQHQGWMEGAFVEQEKVLQEHFGLSWPDWLDKDYDLGS